jgi:hypothetical protein
MSKFSSNEVYMVKQNVPRLRLARGFAGFAPQNVTNVLPVVSSEHCRTIIRLGDIM